MCVDVDHTNEASRVLLGEQEMIKSPVNCWRMEQQDVEEELNFVDKWL